MSTEKTFRTSQVKALLLLVGAGLFVWIGVFVAPSNPLIGWATAIFFGACALIGVLLLVKGASLRLDEEGFEMVGVFKSSRFRWADIESIRMAKIRGTSVIALDYKDGHARRSQVSRSLAGMDASVGNIYNVSLNELCETLKEWHERHGRDT